MWVLLSSVFVVSLLGSLHCVGMCGPFALLAGTNPENRTAAKAATAAYSLGRLLTYTAVGLLFGGLGMALNRGLGFASWQQAATYLAGGLMVLIGAIALGRQWGLRLQLPILVGPLQKKLAWGMARTKLMPPVRRALLIGALTSLMPCGWLYTFAIMAAGTGSPFWGGGLMAVFWAGTVPVMTLLMFGYHRFSLKLQRQLPTVMATLVVLIGLFTIVHRAPVVLGNEWVVATQIDELTQQVDRLDQTQLPCCKPR